MKLIVVPRARAGLDRLRAFLAEQDPQAADRAANALLKSMRLLQDFPGLGRPLNQFGMRDLIVPFGKLAYVVRYFHSMRHDAVTILRIWHGREVRR